MPGAADQARLLRLLDDATIGVLATIRRDGRPQLSNVVFGFDEPSRTIRVSTTADRAKTANLRRDPRGSFHVSSPDGGAYVVAEVQASVSAPAGEPDDATVDELADLYRSVAGEHPDWPEFRQAMVDERRVVLRLEIDRVYGQAPAR